MDTHGQLAVDESTSGVDLTTVRSTSPFFGCPFFGCSFFQALDLSLIDLDPLERNSRDPSDSIP